jgi:2-hydroxy-6-oxonona-2,4-dienedioate hydrolase
VDQNRYLDVERRLFEDAGIAPEVRTLDLGRVGSPARVLDVGEGRPIVFFHGGPNAAATWSYVAFALAGRGMRCLLVDRPGCGLSPAPPFVPDATMLPRYLEDLSADVLDALEIDRAAVVGSSLGGYQAIRAAIAHRDRVSSVVLAGCPPFLQGWNQISFFRLLRTPLLWRLLLAAPVTDASVRMGLQQMGETKPLKAGSIPGPMLAWVAAWQRDTATMRNDALMIRACGTFRGSFDPSLDLTNEELAAVGVPCLVLVGKDDPIGGAAFVGARLPNAEVRELADVGHLPWLAEPTRVADEIAAFVASAKHD